MPEPLLRCSIPGRPGLEVSIARVQALWFVEVLVDGHAVRRAISDDQAEAAGVLGETLVDLALGAAVEDLPLLGPVSLCLPGRVVQVPSAAAEHCRALPWDGDHDPDGGVW